MLTIDTRFLCDKLDVFGAAGKEIPYNIYGLDFTQWMRK
jgi:hypothetical protein